MVMKVADELRKVAQTIAAEGEAGAMDKDAPRSIAKAIETALNQVKQKQERGEIVTAADIEAAMLGMGPLTKAIVMGIVMLMSTMAQAGQDSTKSEAALNDVADSLATIRVEQKGLLPAAKVVSLAGLRATITTKAQEEGYKILNNLDRKLGSEGVKQDARQKVIEPMMEGMGLIVNKA